MSPSQQSKRDLLRHQKQMGRVQGGTSPGCEKKVVFFLFFLFLFLNLFRAIPAAYGSSQARGPIGVTAVGLHHSHSNIRSEPHLQTTPQLLSEAKNQTCILMDTSRICFC